MFQKVLIANRNEIALRVIRACRELGIPTVAVYSTADANALHVRFADEAICIGPPMATKSYLHQPSVLAAAEISGADAIHPGYGFLAENAQFASAVRQLGKTFIGPSVEHLKMFGDKLSAKEAAARAGLPMLKGSGGAVATIEEAIQAAETAGYPVILKAAFGGGGKGMRVVEDPATLERVFKLTQTEAQAAFGNGDVFIERYLRAPRHVEVQVAGDGRGVGLHFGTRDCSMQRRHQKIIEEAPAPNLSDDLRARICKAGADLVANVNYQTVGTVEFLVEGEEFFFLEVNPRIQVEHPVTEEVTGVDLIKLQMELAAGMGFPFTQDEVKIEGHAIEIRVNAENPDTFLPSPGLVTGYHEPGGPGVRIDSAIHEQAVVQPFYDSLTAKLIVKGRDREHARIRLLSAMDEFIVEGIYTTMPLQRELLLGEAFRNVTFWTRYVDKFVEERNG
ncbi:MAG: acetyl-CoA carboxylase biotin carboxylase subunit [Myxococcales bacterium]|nr:acetyl-CoA carboxylase biotin carboxylase subunit [Myxococcales bacterium]MCB9668023.1 acetyl-CoA carboxylase biotin carboxylase subunit [Alphaproteobacteria bacterium]MCB9693476.1 acetyl-CoA carboxylase biotin carboxylase subunit [Alphaproteobacteria bacterium]